MAKVQFELIPKLVIKVIHKLWENVVPKQFFYPGTELSLKLLVSVTLFGATFLVTALQQSVLKADDGTDTTDGSSFVDYVNYWYGSYFGANTTTTPAKVPPKPSFLSRFIFNSILAYIVALILMQFCSLQHTNDNWLTMTSLTSGTSTAYYGRYSKTPYKSSYQPSYRY